MTQILHFDEVLAAISLLYINPLQSNLDHVERQGRFPSDDLQFCQKMLVKVSRSFAAVIQQLPSVLMVDVLVFYLVLRALDTIEDDTTAFASHDEKVAQLIDFTRNALGNPTWTLQTVGEGDEKTLLQHFDKVHAVYQRLAEPSRRIIADVTQRMATGMAEFVSKDLGQGTTTVDQYNRYCHFVAGLVGEGLSRLFAASGLEAASFGSELYLSDQMGLFLQKTNIIRDYLEDYVDKRAFWPQSIWKKYANELGDFCQQDKPDMRDKSLHCLNELITDALELVPDCLLYLSKLRCQEIFRFCAIPQVMAIATLEKCYSNSKVFTGVVKIRKGLSCKLLMQTNHLAQVYETFDVFANMIAQKARLERKKGALEDPSYERTLAACARICDITSRCGRRRKQLTTLRNLVCALIVILAILVRLVASTMETSGSPIAASVLQGVLLTTAFVVYLRDPWSSAKFLPNDNLRPSTVIVTKGKKKTA